MQWYCGFLCLTLIDFYMITFVPTYLLQVQLGVCTKSKEEESRHFRRMKELWMPATGEVIFYFYFSVHIIPTIPFKRYIITNEIKHKFNIPSGIEIALSLATTWMHCHTLDAVLIQDNLIGLAYRLAYIQLKDRGWNSLAFQQVLP